MGFRVLGSECRTLVVPCQTRNMIQRFIGLSLPHILVPPEFYEILVFEVRSASPRSSYTLLTFNLVFANVDESGRVYNGRLEIVYHLRYRNVLDIIY